ncbi:DeoR/GlpR family DNA-binding transcription regulator [Marinicrinis lubricantis]|uniref:DeoR/GlpR family DNA-binding transcription regulator n=1 Tax=Marinicrinis lubricantis TaxID=2086470 RepID=A0ABW1IKR5_9BACL
MAGPKQSKGDKRRDELLNWLKRHGKITVQQMVDQFDISEATARRDLELLEQTSPVIRTIGGAMYDGLHSVKEYSFQERENISYLEKERIAQVAASLIHEGDVVGISGGTTSFLIARALKEKRNITVVTNAVNIAMELASNPSIQIVVSGGIMRGNSFELCGPLAEKMVEHIHIGKMFIGVDGINELQGLATYSEQEASIARALIQRSTETYAVFDHTKAGKTSLFTIAPLDAICGCITDEALPAALADKLAKLNIGVHLPE